SGPTAEHGWVANFGLGVDWEGRCETNSANYAKFLDPGDGSFLRPCAPDAPRGELDAGSFRPTFRGAVAFGPGAVFDIGDTAPYVPVEVPSLTGVPTVRNGAVAVKSATWRLRAADLFDVQGNVLAKPLTIEATGGLTFPAGGVAIAFSAEDAAALREVAGKCVCPILTAADEGAFPANAFALPTELREKGWTLRREGATLNLEHVTGLTFIVR
ncbi:MAG: hypothetical protein ACI4RA_10125, partial [Kiritimatiellia bacterium]